MAGLFESEKTNIFLALAGTSVLKHVVSSWISTCIQPREFQLFGEIEKLVIYPMKSGKGIEMETATCSPLGLSYEGIHDRHWVLATKDGNAINQITAPSLALIQVSIHGDVIRFDAPGMGTLQLPINPTVEQACTKEIVIIGSTIEGLDCGDEAAAWFQEYTQRQGVRFYCSPTDMGKRVTSEQKRNWIHDGRKCDKVIVVYPGFIISNNSLHNIACMPYIGTYHADSSFIPRLSCKMLAFSNFAAFQMINTASLDYLNSQLESPVSFRNFRPSILVKGLKAFEEDNLTEIKIGDATFQLLDKNPRCALVNVDQDTGKSDKGHEPFKTLKKFRTFPKYGPEKPCIGVYIGLNQPARIRVGDPVYYR